WTDENSIMYSCTCPMGNRDVFCKHCVATGLEWLDMRESVEGLKPDEVMKEIERYLKGCRHEELTEVIMHQALSDEELRKELHLRSIESPAGALDVSSYESVVTSITNVDEIIDLDDNWLHLYCSNTNRLIEPIRALLENSPAPQVIDLCEHAIESIELAIDVTADPYGDIGELIESLLEIHHEACRKAGLDPEKLAERLVELNLRSECANLYSTEQYSDILGEKGSETFRRLTEKKKLRLE
ncbi:MAG: hypothetical protein JW738_06945, partial [Actinobacteria bacterium]|nr:hypothetical protein [Actinomycetota bacterium]